MDVEIVESTALSPIQLEAWQQLFDAAPDARFYHHPHWHQCIAEHLSSAQLNLGLLSVDEQLQMVLPLCDSAGAQHRAHPSHDHLSLNDVLIHPTLANSSNELLKAIRLTLNKPGTQWWNWKVSNIPHHATLMQTLTSAGSFVDELDVPSLSLQTVRDNKTDHWLLKKTRESASFNCNADDPAPHGKLRRNLRRLRKQMLELGELRIENVVEPERLLEAYKQFLAVEASGWKGTGNEAPAISANPELKAFYQSLLTPSTHGVTPEINLLWSNDSCIAAQFGMRTGACLSLLKIGYNEEFARYSPGYLLLESILNGALERDIETISLVTSPPWADRWHPDKMPVWQLNHFNNSPLGTTLHKLEQVKQAAKTRLKSSSLTS